MVDEPTSGWRDACPVCGNALHSSWPECPYCRREQHLTERRTLPDEGGPPPPRPFGAGSATRAGDEQATQRQRDLSRGAAPDATVRWGDKGDRSGPGRPGERERSGTMRLERETGALAWLIVKEGHRRGQLYPLREDETLLGTEARCDIALSDEAVSRLHAKVRVAKDGELQVTDFDSTNGTFVNGERISATTTIQENDEIRVGTTVLVLKTLK